MDELDYQVALVVQHRLEQEHKGLQTAIEQQDEHLARALQAQFEQEVVIDSPPPSLSYTATSKRGDDNKCLTDPSWELVDPTPDIHALFLAFDARFFWNKLPSVVVTWSKRMTTCAGICSYQGRAGMCSIALSEPLLKLRPRKDLVETLLHEMIHAYLFLTDDDRDRDGHGPKFHQHMKRINDEAGTHITVYHSFTDEVRLYQQHWWKCDGCCKSRPPFFGLVMRAMNRAPGPSDRWWGEHQRTCGGTFHKIKEPEKSKKGGAAEKKSSKNDIRNYVGSNVKTIKDVKPSGRVAGQRINNSSTVTVTSDKNCVTSSDFKPTVVNVGTSSKVTGDGLTSDFVNVRNHWQNKFNNNKRTSPEVPAGTSSKVPKMSDSVTCPVCNVAICPPSDLNGHLDICLESSNTPEKECLLCYKKFHPDEFDSHLSECMLVVQNCANVVEICDDDDDNGDFVSCVACGKKVRRDDLVNHLDDCMSDIFKDDLPGTSHKIKYYSCPFCLEMFDESDMKDHIEECLKENREEDLLKSIVDDQ